jgi:uncharacterized protein GlcG (DUF336 family)
VLIPRTSPYVTANEGCPFRRLGGRSSAPAGRRPEDFTERAHDNAYYKAYSAASLTLARKEDSTKAVADRMSKSAPTTVPQTPLPNVTYAVGGVTIMSGGNAIGGIGVSGAPGGNFDEECARAGIAKIQDRMK